MTNLEPRVQAAGKQYGLESHEVLLRRVLEEVDSRAGDRGTPSRIMGGAQWAGDSQEVVPKAAGVMTAAFRDLVEQLGYVHAK